MRNIILCEGQTDLLFLQYYMRTINHWNDAGNPKLNFLPKARQFTKSNDYLVIAQCGGCSNIIDKIRSLVERNSLIPNINERFDNIIVVTDHDDIQYEFEIKNNLQQLCHIDSVENNEWCTSYFENFMNEDYTTNFLLIMIPFTQCGAMETLLLDSIAEKDDYDKDIINQCNQLIDNIDKEKRYLTHRRHVIKAKFNTYFSIRVPEDFYTERQKIFQSFPWENYPYLMNVLSKLNTL